MTDEIPPPPEGFVAFPRGLFTNLNGPLFHRPDAGPGAEHAVYLLPRHTNAGGVLHGGMLSAFLDVVMVTAIFAAIGRDGMTAHMSIDFLRAARPGAWLIGRGGLTHATRDMAFAEAQAFVGDRQIGRATGVFKLVGEPGQSRS